MRGDPTDVDKEFFKVEVSEYAKHRNRLWVNLYKSYTLVLLKCTKIARMQLEGLQYWEATNDSYDATKLLNIIKSLLHQATDQKYRPLPLYKSIKSVYCLYQGLMITNTQLFDNLKAGVEVVD